MFDQKSRYKDQPLRYRQDARGRTVTVVLAPAPPEEEIRGYHLLKQGQRMDHLANAYLADPTGYWRLCEANGVMLPEVLTEQAEIAVPNR
ncbi:MAG: hypothetical protein AAFY48_18000 [Bacteroidota bacterium]